MITRKKNNKTMLKQKQFHYKIIVKMSFFIAILF